MKRHITLLVTSIVGFAVAASAAAAVKTKTKRQKPANKDSTSSETSEPASGQTVGESVRANHKIGVDAQYAVAASFMHKYGASASYNDSSKLTFGLTILTGNENFSEDSDDGTGKVSAQLGGFAVYGFGRYFFGNSFNLTGGLGYRDATMNYKLEIPAGGILLNGKVDIQSIVMPLYIGNRWNFAGSGFTIGCDWIGYLVAISGSAKSSLDGNLDNATVKKLNDEMLDISNDLAHKPSVVLLLTSIGWTF